MWRFYYGSQARLAVVFHKVRHPRHSIKWRGDNDCCIICDTCDKVFWCRGIDD